MRQGNRHADSRQRVLQEVLRLRSDEQGNSAVEYSLTLVLLVIGVAGAFTAMIGGIENTFRHLTALLGTIQ